MPNTENPLQIVSREGSAAGDALRFLKQVTGNTVSECTVAGEKSNLVSRYDFKLGGPVSCARGGDVIVHAGANIAKDVEVMTDSGGRAATVAAGFGYALGKRTNDERAAVEGDQITVKLYDEPKPIMLVGAAIASPAGVITPTARVQHVTGTNAVTGITATPFANGEVWSVIPDGAFTWTTATNIAVAGTAVVSRELTFTWDATAVKWYPSYV